MLTPAEKRFIKYWEEQRDGGKIKYYLLYILVGTFIATIVLSFLSAMFFPGFPENLVYIIMFGFVVVTSATAGTWYVNEKKFKGIIQREIQQGKEKDEHGAGANTI